jgi:hypothetical protein
MQQQQQQQQLVLLECGSEADMQQEAITYAWS